MGFIYSININKGIKMNNTNINFRANIKLTPYTKDLYNKMSADNMGKFLDTIRALNTINNKSELILSRKITPDRKIIPVITNLNTGAMVANFHSEMVKITKTTIELLEKVANTNNCLSKILFSNDPNTIKKSIDTVLKATRELSIHPPVSQQKLSHIKLSSEDNLLMRKFYDKFFDKVNIFKLSDSNKLFIKNFDEGYNYYITDLKNQPTGKHFIVNYTANGFRISYDENIITKEEVLKIFKRYTKKAIELH
jgi:hypothetical protein